MRDEEREAADAMAAQWERYMGVYYARASLPETAATDWARAVLDEAAAMANAVRAYRKARDGAQRRAGDPCQRCGGPTECHANVYEWHSVTWEVCRSCNRMQNERENR